MTPDELKAVEARVQYQYEVSCSPWVDAMVDLNALIADAHAFRKALVSTKAMLGSVKKHNDELIKQKNTKTERMREVMVRLAWLLEHCEIRLPIDEDTGIRLRSISDIDIAMKRA